MMDVLNRVRAVTKGPKNQDSFPVLNRGYNQVFRPGRMSLGLVVPIGAYPHGPVARLEGQEQRIQAAEALGFAAVWLRDVPFNVPSFGDAGQLYDPFVYLGYLAASTRRIALGVASIVLPLRHPVHVAKAAASADVLSGGRLILGVASGDRPEEYPALNEPFAERGARFRDSFEYLRRVATSSPTFENSFGRVGGGIDVLPKPVAGRLPLLVTGGSRQDPEWTARHSDGWMTYPRDPGHQARVLRDWDDRLTAAGVGPKPVMQPLYLDLSEDPDLPLQPIHLGVRCGMRPLQRLLAAYQQAGVHHIALNLRFNRADVDTTLKRLADQVLPDFSE